MQSFSLQEKAARPRPGGMTSKGTIILRLSRKDANNAGL